MENMKNGSLSDDANMMDNHHIYYCIVIKRVCVVCRSCGQKYNIHQLAFT